MKEFELVISPGKLPFWRIVVTAIAGTGFLYFVYEAAVPFFQYEITEELCKVAAKRLQFICFCLAAAVYFGTQKTLLIDTDKNLLISEFNIGPIFWRRSTIAPELEYVSFFKANEGEFQVNLWYKGNKHYKMYSFYEVAAARSFAASVAKKLKIDLLDATRKGDFEWIAVD